MRRKINKNSIIIIIIVALFTLSSYSFDQLVIRSEDKIRNLQIKLENTNTEIDNYNSIDSQLMSLGDLSLNEYTHLKRSNKYWLKSIIINTNHKKSYLLKNKNIQKFSKELDINLVYLRFAQHMYDTYLAINIIKNKYADIYFWNSKIFKDEVRPDPHPTSPEVLKALAKVRGSESGFMYAEAFMINKLYQS